MVKRVEAWAKAVEPYLALLQVPVTATFGLLSVFVCFAIAYDLGKQFKLEAVVSATMATVVFLMIQLIGPPLFSSGDLSKVPQFSENLAHPKRTVDIWLAEQLSEETRKALQPGEKQPAPEVLDRKSVV